MPGKIKPVTMKLPLDLVDALHHVARSQGVTMTQIVTDALSEFFARGARAAVDERYAFRLDRLTRANFRLETRLSFVIELLGSFVQHQLTLSAHLPPFESETARLGKARYENLLEHVARQMAQRKRTSDPDEPIGPAE